MTLADQKKEGNIAEYVIYVWQMQDLVRAAQFDSSALKSFLAQSFKGDMLELEHEWILELSKQMQQQKVQAKGSIGELDDILTELNFLHQTLLQVSKKAEYEELYNEAKPNLGEYLKKAGGAPRNDVEACLMALYGLLTLRISGKEVSEATMEAMSTFSKLMAFLSQSYKEMKAGSLNFSLN